MKTIALILDTIENSALLTSLYQNKSLLRSAKKIVVIFIAKENWFNFNDPLNTLTSMNQAEKTGKKKMIKYLNHLEVAIKEINIRAEVVKIVVMGEEKYKITKCVNLMKVEMCLFKNKKKSLIFRLFNKPLHESINEELQMPVVLL